MKANAVAIFALSIASVGAHATGLYGIATSLGGYRMVRIDSTTGVATVLAPIGLSQFSSITGMTYDTVHHKFLAVGRLGQNSAQLVQIDPNGWLTSSPAINPPQPFFEGIEYLPTANRLVLAVGANLYSYTLAFFDDNLQLTHWTWPANTSIDMDTLFSDGSGNLCHLDVNNAWDSSPRHIINNPIVDNWTMTPVGTWAIHAGTELDAAYHPVQNRVYVTRGANLAYYNPAGTTLTNLGSYGGSNVTALAYGAETQTVYGTLVLDDAVTFGAGLTRPISWAIKQGTVTAASGVVTATSPIVNFNITITDDIQGYSIFEWDGSSFLKKKLIIIMPGTTFGFGTVHLRNGDPDHSGEVDAADIDEVVANFGNFYPGPGNIDADVDVSGEVDASDIDIVIANFGAVDD